MCESFFAELLRLLPQLSVTFLGVFLAFMLDRLIEARRRKRDKKDLLRALHDELEETKGKLTGKGNLHFPDIWKSVISSGQIRLLNSEQVTKLARVYRHIQAVEYDAKWVKQAKEDLMTTGHPTQRELLHNRWSEYSERQREREKDLRKKIEEILKEEWWNE